MIHKCDFKSNQCKTNVNLQNKQKYSIERHKIKSVCNHINLTDHINYSMSENVICNKEKLILEETM